MTLEQTAFLRFEPQRSVVMQPDTADGNEGEFSSTHFGIPIWAHREKRAPYAVSSAERARAAVLVFTSDVGEPQV